MSKRNSSRMIDKNWQLLFDKYDILNHVDKHGSFSITSKQINEFKEARLMTKFDYIEALPDLFYDNGLSILPTKRGEYTIGTFNAYNEIDKGFGDKHTTIQFPKWIESLNYENVTSESTMINAAIVSGMVNELTQSDKIAHTVNGRMTSGHFNYKIKDIKHENMLHEIIVQNSQIEIDGGIETEEALYLIEAKNNVTDNFLTRQLYYPFNLWSRYINKPVIPVYLQYRDGVYNFSIFNFSDPNEYSSIELVDRKNFILIDQVDIITDTEISHLLYSTKLEPEPYHIPFPQADDFIKVIELISHLKENGCISKDELSIKFGVHLRQAAYYLNAGVYLKIFDINYGIAYLSNRGVNVSELSKREQKIAVLSQMARYESFRVLIEHRLKTGRKSTPYESESLLTPYLADKYSPSTIRRRSRTVASWIEQLINSADLKK